MICSIGITKENVKNTKIYCTSIKKGTLIFSLPHEIGVDMDGYDTYNFFSLKSVSAIDNPDASIHLIIVLMSKFECTDPYKELFGSNIRCPV